MGIGRTNKMMGSNAEKMCANFFKGLGFDLCTPSRNVSKRHDNAKIDLMNIPFNFQVKAGKQSNMNPGKELLAMESCINLMFPKEDEVFLKPCLLLHYKETVIGEVRLPEHQIVYMSLQQFNYYKDRGSVMEYLSFKEFKFDLNSEFKSIVGVTLEVFREQVIIKHYQK